MINANTTLICPDCGGTMTFTGAGITPGTTTYFCCNCRSGQQRKELFHGCIQNTGSMGFSYVFLPTLSHLGNIRMNNSVLRDGLVRPGDQVLVFLGQGNSILAVYRNGRMAAARPVHLPAQPPVHRPFNPPVRSYGGFQTASRRWGVVESLLSPTHGRIRDLNTGEAYHLHVTNTVGSCMRVGNRVTFTPSRNGMGPIALNVQAN